MSTMIRSHRQEAIDEQLGEIERVLNAQRNEFEPGKNTVYDKNYQGDKFEYQFQQEEKSLQD